MAIRTLSPAEAEAHAALANAALAVEVALQRCTAAEYGSAYVTGPLAGIRDELAEVIRVVGDA